MKQKITLPSGFSFDGTNMLGEGRITEQELHQLAPRIAQAAAAVDEIRRTGKAKNHLSKDGTPEPVYFPRLPYPGDHFPNTPGLLEELKAFGESVRQNQDVVIFCGVGGSYLGGKVLYDCANSEFWPHRPNQRPSIFFSGNNVDSEDMIEIQKWLEALAQNKNPLKVLLVPISKSGTTMEPTTAFLYFYEYLSRRSDRFEVRGAVVTDKLLEKGPLNRIARKFNWPIFDVPVGIGGRFSVLSTPGLVVGAVLGMDLPELLRGARDMDEACRSADIKTNSALFNATLKYVAAADHGATIEIIMPYAMRLKGLGEWYVQLLAESLGKRNNREGKTVFYGRTPVAAVGTTDMHAQTQMHQEGRRDKVVQFLFVKSWKGKLTIHNPFPEIAEYQGYEGLDAADALQAAMEANEEALSSDNRLNALYTLPELNEYTLGQLFYFLMLSIAYEGELADVDAYDQPGVEIYKRIMKAKLKKK